MSVRDDTTEYLSYGWERSAVGVWEIFKDIFWRYMHALLHLNLHSRENNILLWAKAQIEEISFLFPMNYFWWKASQCFCYRHADLHTEHFACTHRESSTRGAQHHALLYTQAKLSLASTEETEIRKWEKEEKKKKTKHKPNNPWKCQHSRACR